MIYTIEQIDEILKEQGWHSCICNNEMDGEYCFGYDTIQVSEEEDMDYFGEFFGDREENQYAFRFYIK